MTAQQIADVLDVDLNRLKENREAMTDFYAAMGMRVKSEQSTCSVSNGHISSETKTTWSCIQNTAIIRIGGQTTAGLRHLFGHVRNFRIWHKALTDAQVGESI